MRWLSKPWVRLLLGLVITLGLGLLLIQGMKWTEVVREFRGVPVHYALASLAFFIVATVLRAYRWQVLFVQQKVTLARLVLVQNAGIGLNNLVPLRVVGEAAQYSLLTRRYHIGGGEVLATLAIERVLDMIVSAILLIAGLLLLSNMAEFIPYIVGAFIVAVAATLLIPGLVWASHFSFFQRLPLLVSVADSLVTLAKHKRALPFSFLWTLMFWLGVGFSSWILAYGMGLNISPFVVTVAILGTVYFSTSMPGLPLAAGTFEFAMVYVLRFFEVGQELAFSYAVIIHAILFIPATVVAIVVFPSLVIKPFKRRQFSTVVGNGEILIAEGQESTG